MEDMFKNTKSFNQPLNKWNINNVNNMYCIFYNSIAFNQPETITYFKNYTQQQII